MPFRRMGTTVSWISFEVTESRTMAGSLPPSSMQSGVRDLAAEAATAWATGREPMKRRWAMPGWEVRCWATFGQQTSGCIRSFEWEQATRAERAMEAK